MESHAALFLGSMLHIISALRGYAKQYNSFYLNNGRCFKISKFIKVSKPSNNKKKSISLPQRLTQALLPTLSIINSELVEENYPLFLSWNVFPKGMLKKVSYGAYRG